MDGVTAMGWKQRWTTRWQCNGNATAVTMMAMGSATAMGRATVTTMATVVMDGVTATAMEGTMAMRWQ